MFVSKRLIVLLLAVVAILVPTVVIAGDDDDDNEGEGRGRRFEIGLIGDTRYTPEQQAKFPNLIAEMNRERLEFIVHDGDIKAGANACANNIYTETRDLFNQFRAPLIYTPGDNEWTDCHRAGGDPLERLSFLRQTFYPNSKSLGQRPMTLQRQNAQYPENVMWTHGAITFATLHIVGSNNNKPVGTVGNQGEYDARNAANLAWMSQTFNAAVANNSVGVMLITQANMWDAIPAEQLAGFADTIAALRQKAIAFNKPVVLVNGDSHYFRIDKPLLSSPNPNRRLEWFTRVETFGTDDVHWVRASIDPRDPEVFSFQQEIVEANLVDHTP